MVHAEPGRLLHLRLGVERHAHAGRAQHGKVIGAVAHGDRIPGRDSEPRGDAPQRLQLRLLAEDRKGHLAGEAAILHDQLIGLVLVEAEHGSPCGR